MFSAMNTAERVTIKECAQKNGKIDKDSNDDKEEICGQSYISGYIDDTDSENDRSCVDSDSDDDKDDFAEKNDRRQKDVDADSAIDESINDFANDVIIMGLEPSHIVNTDDDNSTITTTAAATAAAAVAIASIDAVSTAATKASSNATTTMPSAQRRSVFFRGPNRFCRLMKMYGRQVDSVMCGFILMFTTGFQIVWGLNILYSFAHRNHSIPTLTFFVVSIYYVGAIAGTFLAAALIRIVRKRMIHMLAVGIGLLSCLLFQLTHDERVLLFGRLLAGIFHGLVYLTTIVHATENASKFLRHPLMIVFSLNMCVAMVFGAMLGTPFMMNEQSTHKVITVPMIILLVFVALATHIFTRESPIYLLQHQKIVYEEDLSQAYDTFVSLQRKNISQEEIDCKFDEIKAMLAEESPQTRNPFTDGNFKPLFLVACCRLVAVLSFNLPFVVEMLHAETFVFGETNTPSNQTMIVIGIWLIVGTAVVCILHSINRKYLLFLFSTVFGISSTFVRILFIFDVRHSLVFHLPMVLLFFYFYIVALPLEAVSNLALSEAFSTPKRPYSIASIVSCEHLVHIVLLVMHFYGMSNTFLFVTSLGLMGLSFKVYWSLPRDTNNASLQQSVFAYRTATAREWYAQANSNSRCVV